MSGVKTIIYHKTWKHKYEQEIPHIISQSTPQLVTGGYDIANTPINNKYIEILIKPKKDLNLNLMKNK